VKALHESKASKARKVSEDLPTNNDAAEKQVPTNNVASEEPKVATSVQPQVSIKDLQTTALSKLLSASQDGSLAKAIEGSKTSKASEVPVEENEQPQGTLAKAKTEAFVSNVLDQEQPMLTTSKSVPVSVSEEEAGAAMQEIEALRRDTKDLLLKATNEGILETMLAELRQTPKGTEDKIVEEKPEAAEEDSAVSDEKLRKRTARLLLQATSEGSLSRSLDRSQRLSPTPKPSGFLEESPEDENVGKQAKETLFLAASDGRLESALQGMKAPQAEENKQTADAKQAEDSSKEEERAAPTIPKVDKPVPEAAPEKANEKSTPVEAPPALEDPKDGEPILGGQSQGKLWWRRKRAFTKSGSC